MNPLERSGGTGSQQPPRCLLPVVLALVATGTVSWLFALGLRAQAPAPAIKLDVVAARGLQVSPIYDGWYLVGATKYALFGYFNRNLEEIANVPVGPDNAVTPGPADQGQPTRFFPGQHVGVFAVAVPDAGSKTELTWTLAFNGYKFSIPAFLDPLYLIQPQRDDAGTLPWQYAADGEVRSDRPIGAGTLRRRHQPNGRRVAAAPARCVGRRRRSPTAAGRKGSNAGPSRNTRRSRAAAGADGQLGRAPRARRGEIQQCDAAGRGRQSRDDGDVQHGRGVHAAFRGRGLPVRQQVLLDERLRESRRTGRRARPMSRTGLETGVGPKRD